jgi:hypothetical protein
MTTPGSDPSGYGDSGSGSMPPPPSYQGGTGYPGEGTAVAAPKNGFGITALVLGIIAIVLSWSAIGGIVFGVLAIIFAILGIRRANRGIATNKGMSISGLVTGIIGLIIGVIVAIALGSFLSVFGGSLNNFSDCVKQAGNDQAKVQQCENQFQQQVQQQQNGS